MTPARIIADRGSEWRELEDDVAWLRAARGRRLDPGRVAAFARRYRAACSDLGLAVGMRFPKETVDYLQQLVADAHTQLYRIESFTLLGWLRSLLLDVPRRAVSDPCTWIAAAVFAGTMLVGIVGGGSRPGFAAAIVGEEGLATFERMYAEPPRGGGFTEERSGMAGFYVLNNAGIGLHCFAFGLLGGVGSLVVLALNGLQIGTVFGHMLASPLRGNFTEFVMAHGPFELTAIVLSAGAGLRLGWSLIDTRDYGRWESLRRSASEALGTAGLATVLFFLAAFVEAFISPAPLPRWTKALVAAACGLALACLAITAVWRPSRRIADAA